MKKHIQNRTLIIAHGGATLSINADDLSPAVLEQAMMHGLSQKIGDAAAGKTDAQAVAAMTAVIAALRAGTWNAGRTGMGDDLTEAVMTVTGKTRTEVDTMLASKTKEEVDALRKHPQVAAAIAAIRAKRAAERAQGAPSLDALLG